MTCIVSYDIEENRRRTKLAKLLLSKGIRIQKSVFAIEVESYQFKGFLKKIENIISDRDHVAIFRLCKGCMKNAIKVPDEDEKIYVY